MKNKFIFAVIFLLCILFLSGNIASASEIIKSANEDWLNLVRQYTSADNIEAAEDSYKWDRLVKDYEKTPSKLSRSKRPESLLAQWWDILGDETLTQLIERAFESNKDLQTARAKVLEARATLGLSKTAFQPKVNGTARYTNGKQSEPNYGVSYNDYYLAMDASWELDFFGKNKHTMDAAKANLEAGYADLHNAWVSLSAEVAINYITLRTLQNRLRVANRNIEIQTEMLEMLESQYRAGLKDELAVQQERYTLEQTRSAIPDLMHSIEEMLTTLAILTGEIPGSLHDLLAPAKPLPAFDVANLIGIPAQAIRQRPDIRAAERRLAAQISQRKSTEKTLYPTISLTGSIGFESLSSGRLFTDMAHFYNIVPSITWPIFNAGQIRKNIQIQSAVEEQLISTLEGVILQAVKEVHDVLNANAKEIEKYSILMEGLKSARSALDIARDKYLQGLTDFNNVLTAQQYMFSAEDACAASEGQKIINLINLFKALGGGWEPLR